MTSYHIPLAQVAEVLGVSYWTVNRLVRRGEIPAVKVAGRYVIPFGELQAWIRRHRTDYAGGPMPEPQIEGPDPWAGECSDPTPTPPPR